jgi:hypothetical protein
VIFAELEIFLGVEGGGAFDPGVDGVGGDDVKFFAGGEEEVAAVVVNDFEAGVVENVVIFFGEVAGDDPGDEGFDFADDDAPDAGIEDEGAGGDGSVEASTLPLTWKLRTPSENSETATEEIMPSPT